MGQIKRGSNHQSSKNIINSPRKSDNGSVTSNNSLSKKNGKSQSQKINLSKKNSSVFDSDT